MKVKKDCWDNRHSPALWLSCKQVCFAWFFDSLHAEIYKNNIRVTLVCPGFVNTSISKNVLIGNVSPQGKLEIAAGNGMSSKRFAVLMIKAIKNRRGEVYLSGMKEKFGMYLKRFFQNYFLFLSRKYPLLNLQNILTCQNM